MLAVGFVVYLCIVIVGTALGILFIKEVLQMLWIESLKVALRITKKIKKALDNVPAL